MRLRYHLLAHSHLYHASLRAHQCNQPTDSSQTLHGWRTLEAQFNTSQSMWWHNSTVGQNACFFQLKNHDYYHQYTCNPNSLFRSDFSVVDNTNPSLDEWKLYMALPPHSSKIWNHHGLTNHFFPYQNLHSSKYTRTIQLKTSFFTGNYLQLQS